MEKTVVSVGASAFKGDGITGELTIPDNYKAILINAFEDNKIEKINFGSGLSKIYGHSFRGNMISGELTIPNSIELVDMGTFEGNQIESVIFGENVKKSGIYAFKGNKITKVQLNEGLSEIALGSFTENNITDEIKIPDSLKLVDEMAFDSNPSKENPQKVILRTNNGDNPNKIADGDNFAVDPEINLSINRISGANRFLTAIELSKEIYDTAETVVIVNAYTTPDALTSSVLSDLLNGPILLTKNNEVPKETIEEITRLGAKNIVIVGGGGSVSKNVEKELGNYKVSRLSGKNRYETSMKVAEEVLKLSKDSKEVIFASGNVFADALSSSSLATKNSSPIILVNNAMDISSIEGFIGTNKINKVYIAGGEGSVSKDFETKLSKVTDVERLSGLNRYETAVKIAEKAYPKFDKLLISSGENEIDAMVAGAITAKYHGPILLVRGNDIPSEVKTFISNHNKNIKKINIVGGEGSVSKNVEELLGK